MTTQKNENEFIKLAGICLLFGSLLATVTMALHPVGGSLVEIASKKNIFFISHSLALLSIPFVAFGFWGLATFLDAKNRISFLALTIGCFGLVAVMIAATVNGFVLPIFASKYANSSVDGAVTQAVRDYGWFLGEVVDNIFVGGLLLAVGIWSVLIIRSNQIPKWLGYFGLILLAFCLVALLARFNFTNLHGIRIFVIGLVFWKVTVGFYMIKLKK
jgi:hypothetical protein